MPGSDFDKRIYSYVVNTINELKESGRLPEGKNLNAAGIAAQIILETGHGKSKLSQEAYNYGGIKADSSWTGDTYTSKDGSVYRKYESAEQGLADQLSFYLDNPRYDNAGALDATNASDWAKAIKKAGYAEDPDYVKKLNSISRKFEDPTYQDTESSVEPVNTSSTNSQYKPLEKVNVGTVDNYQLPNIDYSVTGENTKVDNTIPYKPMTTPTVNTSFTGQSSMFKLGGNLFPDGGPLNKPSQVFTYPNRPGVRYALDGNGKWLVNVPDENNKGWIPLDDPDGSKSRELMKNAESVDDVAYDESLLMNPDYRHLPTTTVTAEKPTDYYNTLIKPTIQFMDPTGITSWGDVKESYDKNGLFSGETAFEILGALPLLGKIGKSGKILGPAFETLVKANKTINKLPVSNKTKEVLFKTVGKSYDKVKDYDNVSGSITKSLKDNIKYINPSSQKVNKTAVDAFNTLNKTAKLANKAQLLDDTGVVDEAKDVLVDALENKTEWNYTDDRTFNFKLGGNMNKYYATGGPMEGMPTDGQAGQLTSFDAGGKHEENPMGGIPQGMNPNGQQNLVEEGETKLNAKNYIFSDSLKIDKDTAKEFYFPSKYVGKTFAEVSKLMERPDSRRKHDSIEENAKKKDLEALMSAQEEFKAKDLQRDMENMMVKHPDFMQSMLAQQAPQMPEQAPVDPMMAQDPMMQQGMPMEAPMAKMGGYQNQMNFGGFMNKVGQVGKNYGLALADNALGMVGANNVIKDSDYTGAGSEFAKGAQQFTGVVNRIGQGVAAAALPGIGGALVGGAQNAMGGIGGENTTIQNGRVMEWGGGLNTSNKYGNYSTGVGLDNPYLQDNGLSNSTLPVEKSLTIPSVGSSNVSGQGAPEAQSYDQSLANAIGTYAPVAYNIGQGLFGKVDKLSADDYINKATIENYRENINPQLRASDEAFAGAKKGLRNAGAGSGAYMANLQAMHSQDQAQKAGIYANAENQYAGRQLQIDQANASRGDQAAAMRLQIHDYNMRAKAAKDTMLQEGLKQTGDISKAKTSNELATMYNNLYAPDFKDFASYNSYADMLKQKAQAKKKNK